MNTVDGETGYRDAVGGNPGRMAILVVLFDDDAIVSDTRESDVLVDYAGNGTLGFRDGLNADA